MQTKDQPPQPEEHIKQQPAEEGGRLVSRMGMTMTDALADSSARLEQLLRQLMEEKGSAKSNELAAESGAFSMSATASEVR